MRMVKVTDTELGEIYLNPAQITGVFSPPTSSGARITVALAGKSGQWIDVHESAETVVAWINDALRC